MKIVTTANGQRTEHEIEDKPGGLTVLVHDQGIRVDAPEFVEVNPRDTVDCMAKMTQKQWEWVSTGDLFRQLWQLSFDKDHRGGMPNIPTTVVELNSSDYGMIHVAGMITLGCEAVFVGKSVFFRNPETYLHPSSERMIATMLHKMLELCGAKGTVAVAEKELENVKKRGKKEHKPRQKPKKEVDNSANDKELTLKWLNSMEPTKPVARVGPEATDVLTAGELIPEVTNDTDIGRRVIDLFVILRDGGRNV